MTALARSATLVVILSPAYLNSVWCTRERNAFLSHAANCVKEGRIFIVRHRKTEQIKRQAEWLRRYGNVAVTIEGHCDERGTREYNLALGERRAQAAKNVLVALGIPAARISTISYGKERPAVPGSADEAYAQNRRAVTTVN